MPLQSPRTNDSTRPNDPWTPQRCDDAEWLRLSIRARLETAAKLHGTGLFAVTEPLFTPEERQEFIELKALAATLNWIVAESIRKHPIPLDRVIRQLEGEAERRGRLDARFAAALRVISELDGDALAAEPAA